MTQTTYDGNQLFNNYCGLYAIDSNSEFEFDYHEALEEAKYELTKYFLPAINTALEIAGLKCVDFTHFIPREFNYMDTSLDPVIEITDEKKLLNYLIANKETLQKELNSNKSYDGFMALTSESIEEDIKACLDHKKEYRPDIMIIKYILKDIAKEIDEDFHMYECIQNIAEYQPEEPEKAE